MTERDAFMDAIRESPDDDTPRLMFADWLDERGECERAEFIRVQCELAILPINSPRHSHLSARQTELLKGHETAWRAELPALPGVQWGAFERGFVGIFIVYSVAAFEASADAILAAPTVPTLWLIDRERAAVAALTRARHLHALCGLILGTQSSSEQLVELFRSGRLGRLSQLVLQGQPLRRLAVRALADASCLGRLRQLYLEEVGLGTRGAVALASSSRLTGLTSLALYRNAIGPEGTTALAESPILGRVTDLDLCGASIGPTAVRALASLPRLRRLQLSGNHIGDTGARLLASSPHLGSLVTLHLEENEIGDPGAIALGQSTNLSALKQLNLLHNRISDVGLAALLNGEVGRELISLNLSDDPLTAEGRLTLKRHNARTR
jgi:uncharacterized protein (TIGR02996 family)